MNEENQISYYSVIPAPVRYDIELKPAEKLMYSEITSLTNKSGYCFARNKYFADLYKVTIHTVSQWISHLEKLGYIHIELIKNVNKEIKGRRIYINDRLHVQNNTSPYVFKSTYPMYKKIQYNNKNINIDGLFNYIIKGEGKIPIEFSNVKTKDIVDMLERYEMLYTNKLLKYISEENLVRIKDIIYTIALLVKNNIECSINKVSRDKLVQIYNECKSRKEEYKGKENKIENFINYYYKSVINELRKEKKYPSFFVSKNS